MPDPAVLAAIASPRRREILRLTWNAECGAGEIRREMPDVSWGAVSLQLKSLVEAGLLNARIDGQDGRRRFYRANRSRLSSVADMLEHMWRDALGRLKLAAELEASRRGPRPQRRRKRAGRTPSKPKRTR
ncbi:MAG TPA: winged helix-turn-helix domain-containing protein [Vicinamibacterales bacterium]|nr:winged helix-turn-helix domain-containing protein [Vicinamibacterales bacterium]